MGSPGDEDELLRSVALKNASTILQARQRAEEELVRTKEALRESQEQLTAALAASGTCTFRWDIPTGTISWGGEVARMFGLTAEGLTPLETFCDVIHPDDRAVVRAAYARVASDGASLDTEFRIICPDGDVRWIADKARVFRDARGTPLYMTGACTDITKRKGAEAALQEETRRAAAEREELLESERAARSAAERMSEVKDEFLATLSHELRTPLNAILGWAHILRSRPLDQAAAGKALETIERNARVQTQLIEDLLDTSRIAAGKVRLDVQSLQPSSVIDSAVETVRPAADAKGITLSTLLDRDAGPISGDPGRLQQVVWNLLSNAIKFTPKGGRVQVVLERVNSHIEITVADTGIGIRREFLPHLFERFRQGDASTTRTYGGLGLGLSIVRNLVELHGGLVKVDSPGEGFGTTVTVELPLMVVHRSASTARRHPAAPDTPALGDVIIAPELAGLTILVVDDQEDARLMLKRVLEDHAAGVLTAENAEEALALVDAHRPDILVSDIGMPGVDGFELLRRVRALGPERGGRMPAIALTAFARSEDRTRALRAGFQVHIAKPVDPSELVATIASVAGRVSEP